MGYGISVNYKDAVILIGGSNEQGHLKSVYKFTYNDSKLKFEMLPDLPNPIANTCGVLVGDVIYVMGGITDPDAKWKYRQGAGRAFSLMITNNCI